MSGQRKKGFTLVELLVTIILLGVIGAIIIYNMTSVHKTNQENEYDRYIATVKSAAAVYADMFPDVFNELYVSKAYVYITLDELVSNGLLDEDLTNPYTNEKINLDEIVKANLDSTNGAVTFEYPLKSKQQESVLVTLDDYVVWGEPYDCMRGLGTYELAISDEEGNIINLDPETEEGRANIKAYNFECKLPDEFDEKYDQNGVTGMRTRKAGEYDVTYTWLTKSGTKKKAVRKLYVQAMVTPSFKVNYDDYDFSLTSDRAGAAPLVCSKCDSNNFFKTSYNSTTKTWDYLAFEPLIEGADAEYTEIKITKTTLDPTTGSPADITGGYIPLTDASHEWQVDDGYKMYTIDTIVHGHYYHDYTYQATGSGEFRAELVIPEDYLDVNPDNNNVWTTSKTYSIDSDTTHRQSPVGIKEYEFRLSTDATLDKNLKKIDSNTFAYNKVTSITTKDVSVINDLICSDEKKEYSQIFFRAINNDGYVGAWTKYDTLITNQIGSLIESDVCSTKSSTCCYGTKNNANDAVSKSVCDYNKAKVYIKFGGYNFVALGKDNKNQVLVVTENDTNVRVSPLSVRNGYAQQVTCDGTYYKYYSYYVANDAILSEARRWVSSNIGKSKHLVEPAYGSYSVYSLHSALLSKYGEAIRTTSGRPAWLLDNGVSSFTVYLDQPHKHGNESTTAYNAYFYYTTGLDVNRQYVGQTNYVRPIIKLKDLNICSGNGTKGNPYVVNK